ncbi:calcium-binding protein [Cognatishimia sp. F0-27]|uniref:calcium-binding protein n=1 Tax=Cognatishimia sp. F0-27 TaxID=2816855 RepID=UPI001D0C6D5B|nr:calcium-binding protein [Cognatishimia sp. F0-27]MCC1492050.1 hypothetical protein [Cognatishimia sp. F0-27]
MTTLIVPGAYINTAGFYWGSLTDTGEHSYRVFAPDGVLSYETVPDSIGIALTSPSGIGALGLFEHYVPRDADFSNWGVALEEWQWNSGSARVLLAEGPTQRNIGTQGSTYPYAEVFIFVSGDPIPEEHRLGGGLEYRGVPRYGPDETPGIIDLRLVAGDTATENDSVSASGMDETFGLGYGNDTYTPAAGNDVIWGGPGEDKITLAETGNIDLIFPENNTGSAFGNSFWGFENMDGTEAPEDLRGDGGNNWITGLGGSDTLIGRAGDDTLDASASSSTSQVMLSGRLGNDLLLGGAGEDQLDGGPGSDTAEAGSGDDTVQGNGGDDSIDGGGGNDVLGGGFGDDTILAGSGIDTIHGGAGADSIDGGSEDDLLIGNAGGDTLVGNTGRDTLWGGADGDSLVGNDGADRLHGQTGNDTLGGGAGNDGLYGGADADRLSGGTGDDLIYGGEGNDQLFGDAGADTLYGGEGSDRFWIESDDLIDGEDGGDRFVFRPSEGGENVVTGGEGADQFVFGTDPVTSHSTITDFEIGTDEIEIYYTREGGPSTTSREVIDGDLVWEFSGGGSVTFIGITDADAVWDSVYSDLG